MPTNNLPPPPPLMNKGENPFPQGNMSDPYQSQPGPSPSSSSLPVDQVINLRQQGLSNNQIVQTLQNDGYDSGQIFDAMNQADMQGGAGGPIPMDSGFQEPPPMDQGEFFPQDNMNAPMMGRGQNVEELAEAIINEKWEELVKSINRIMEWKDASENRMARIEQQVKDLKSNFDNLHQAIVGKIGEYDKNILNVGTEIKAMEKVFQKVLPTFTENVNELSRITKNMRR